MRGSYLPGCPTARRPRTASSWGASFEAEADSDRQAQTSLTAKAAVAVIAATVAAAMGLAACGGRPAGPGVVSRGSNAAQPAASSSSSGSPSEQALAFSRCVRSHGVPNFPDPNSSGNLPASSKQIAHNSPQFAAAANDCRHLLPNSGNGPTPAQWQQILGDMVKFARCVRHHGMPNWPDPTYDTHGRPVFNVDIDPTSLQFSTEIDACQHLLHNYGSRPGWPDLSNYFQYRD